MKADTADHEGGKQTPDEMPGVARSQQVYKYWAYITYSHRDEGWVKWLHRALETYRVPKRLVGRATKAGTVPARVFPIFRDRDDLASSPDLSEEIKEALSQARCLIVICSPNAVRSRWVNEEVKLFKSLRREDRILCMIVDGEPNATDTGNSSQECFPPAVRFRLGENGEWSEMRCEVLAADARDDKDGKTDAKLKLLAGILDLDFDELKAREHRRQLQRRVRTGAALAGGLLAAAIAYNALVDAGLNLPAAESIRSFADRHEISVFRYVHTEAKIRQQAAHLRRKLFNEISHSKSKTGWISHDRKSSMESNVGGAWTQSQALYSLFRTPDATREELRDLLPSVEVLFAPSMVFEKNGVKYGWRPNPLYTYPLAEPGLWTAAAIAAALGRSGVIEQSEREHFLNRFHYVQESLSPYKSAGSGGWHMFVNQKDPTAADAYTTSLALLALLETQKADLPWLGSKGTRDVLLREGAQWLIQNYDSRGDPPGWTGNTEDTGNVTQDGLTLQIYALLLRASREAQVALPSAMWSHIREHLARCVGRSLNFPVATAEFYSETRDFDGREQFQREAINFLWQPWAIECSVWALRSAQAADAPPEQRVQLRRTLSHLVVALGEEFTNAASAGPTFVCSETLAGLASIDQPTAFREPASGDKVDNAAPAGAKEDGVVQP